MHLNYASAVIGKQVINRHGCSTKGCTKPVTIGPIDMALGWKPVNRETVGRKKLMKKGYVIHNHDLSDFFLVNGAVVPPSPGLYRVNENEKKERETR